MKLLLQQQQQQQQLSGNNTDADAANLLSQQSLIQQQTNFAAAMTNNMCTTVAASNGGDIGLGTFTQNDRITPPLHVALPLPHAQHEHLRQLQQQQQLLLQSQQQQESSHMSSSSTAAAAARPTNNNLFAGIDPTQMMHLPQSSQNTILQRQYQATADRIAEEHKARAIQSAGQRMNGTTGTNANAAGAAGTNTASGGTTAHRFLQSLQNDTMRGQHIANVSNTNNDVLADIDAEVDVDASDPLMASLQMYSQYGEDSTPLAVNTMVMGGAGNHFNNGNNGQLQTNNIMCGNNDFGAPSTRNDGGVDDKLQQLQTIQAQLAQLQRMEIEMKQQAEAQEKQLQQQRQLQQRQQQQQSFMLASASASTQSAGRATPPNNNDNCESSGRATPLSPPSLPVDAAMSDVAVQGMRAKVQQYEAAARSMLLQEGKRRRSKIDASSAATAAGSASTCSGTSAADTDTSKADVPSAATIAQTTVSSPRHQQHQRRRSSVVSNGSSSTGDETPGRKRRAPDQSWRDVMKDDPDVKECRAKMRRRV